MTVQMAIWRWRHKDGGCDGDGDCNGDGDYDVISGSVQDNKTVWFENLDGLGSFGNEKIINDTPLSATDITAADIDGS